MGNDRRNFIKQTASLAACLSIGDISRSSATTVYSKASTDKKAKWPVTESKDTPKIILNSSANASTANMRLIKQFGVDYVLMGGPQLPIWISSQGNSGPRNRRASSQTRTSSDSM